MLLFWYGGIMDETFRCRADAIRGIAAEVERRVCRISLDVLGFCLIDLGGADSLALRQAMFDLKDALAARRRASSGQDLVFLSAARFDQQVTTKFHRDGGPDEYFLMLGYEPSAVAAELAIADYSRCAFNLGITPAEFLARYNPMFRAGATLLEPYITRLTDFHHDRANIVLINNSMAAFDPACPAWQGVLHTAVIPHPDERHRRIINSTMLAPAPAGDPEPLGDELAVFLTTSLVRRHGYDKPHLSDDE